MCHPHLLDYNCQTITKNNIIFLLNGLRPINISSGTSLKSFFITFFDLLLAFLRRQSLHSCFLALQSSLQFLSLLNYTLLLPLFMQCLPLPRTLLLFHGLPLFTLGGIQTTFQIMWRHYSNLLLLLHWRKFLKRYILCQSHSFTRYKKTNDVFATK